MYLSGATIIFKAIITRSAIDGVVDPKGASSSQSRVLRGGG